MAAQKSPSIPPARAPFDYPAFLAATGTRKTRRRYKKGELIFTQGGVCSDVLYLQSGSVTLSVRSKTGRDAVVGVLGKGSFLGEGCLTGQTERMGSATALTPSVVVSVPSVSMRSLLHGEHAMSDQFIAHILARNVRLEQDLVNQLFNSVEKRLARTLLVMARYGTRDRAKGVIPTIPPAALADMIGTTRPHLETFLEKFKSLGFIEYDDALQMKVNYSLLNIVLHD